MIDLSGYRKALASLDAGIAWAEVNAHEAESTEVSVSGGKVLRTAAHTQAAFYVRACGEKLGTAYTQDAAENPAAVIRRAVENGRYREAPSEERLTGERIARAAQGYPPADLQAMVDTGAKLCALAREAEPHIRDAIADICVDTDTNSVLNSEGLDVDASRMVYSAALRVMAEKDGRQFNAEAQVTAETLNGLDLKAAARRCAQTLSHQYAPLDLRSGRYAVVLDSAVVINILTTAWQLFAGTKMQTGASALAGLMGQRVGSEGLSITDSPVRDGCGYRFLLDDEGIAGGKTELLRDGVLTGLLHTQATAAKAGATPTGNSGRVALLSGSIPTELIPIPRILCVELGTETPDTLLAHMGDGVWITQSYDVFHSINIGSGDFSIPCRGSVVKNGKSVYNVTGMTLSGNLKALFADVREVGNDLWIDPFLLKSYCIGAPSLRVGELQVNGKG